MNIRQPFQAGSFYEESPSACRHHAAKLIDSVELPDDLPQTLYGGLVPHAGWMFSGSLAATTFLALATGRAWETVILFGADHTGSASRGEVYDSGVWRTPLGELPIDEELAAELVASCEYLRSNPQAHRMEHSIEVQLPIIEVINPNSRIVPIAVAPFEHAVDIGQAVGRVLAGSSRWIPVVGSTDLTHHGGHFPAPGGRGRQGVDWTVSNDRRMLGLIEQLAADKVVPESVAHGNACGAGAIAATITACQAQGAKLGRCLQYTNSYEVVHAIYPGDPDDTTVGYASVVFE